MASGGYEFIKNMWIMGRYNSTNIAKCVTKEYITQEEADTIIAMEQAETTAS